VARAGAALILLWAASGCASSPGAPDPEAARVFLEEGRRLAAAGDLRGAVERYTRAIQANPEMPEAYYGRGCAHVRLRLSRTAEGDARLHEERALADFGAAIRLDPTFADAYFNRAMVLCYRAQFKPAAEDLLSAIRFKPKDPEPHLLLGRLYEEKFEDRLAAAHQHYEKYVELGGRDPDVREKVRAYQELKRLSSAPAKTPTPEDEKKAEELMERFKLLFPGSREEALKAVEEMVSKYGHTQFVQKQARQIEALLRSLRKEAPGKVPPGGEAPRAPGS